MLATLKFGIPHELHDAGHGVHSFALLSATKPAVVVFAVVVPDAVLEIWHTPLASVCTHCICALPVAPLKPTRPAPHTTQSALVGPVHVEHKGEHGAHAVPLLKEPSGQSVPLEVVVEDVEGTHVEGEVGDWVKPDWQVMHAPEDAAQDAQPSAQTVLFVSFWLLIILC